MDQTKFINSYIANLAEKIKALTLDNIMLSTQLTMANETAAELQNKIQLLENQVNQSIPSGDYVDSDRDLKFDTSESYSAGNEMQMSTIVQIKRSETTSAIPTSGQLAIGELALNLTDKKLFSKKANGDIVSIGGVGVDGGAGTT